MGTQSASRASEFRCRASDIQRTSTSEFERDLHKNHKQNYSTPAARYYTSAAAVRAEIAAKWRNTQVASFVSASSFGSAGALEEEVDSAAVVTETDCRGFSMIDDSIATDMNELPILMPADQGIFF